MRFPIANLNKKIKNNLNVLSLDERNKLISALVNFMDFHCSEPGYFYVSDPTKIEKSLESLKTCFLNKIWDISSSAHISYSHLFKIITQDSPLLGEPFPEKSFIRLRLDLKTFVILGPSEDFSE